ncbi:MAG: T9SS type A sorting domain-containing protein [Flavobacteriales bacterium]
MKSKFILLTLLAMVNHRAFSQSYPVFGPEIKVTVTGLAFDAMEPFISLDGNTLFFNSLNSGGNTNLYYATKVNDSTFTYVGLVGGCYDPAPGHLDAVPSLDSINNFFWVSLRNYPAVFDNLHRGVYAAGSVSNFTRVHGDFNIYLTNWLIMDAAISYQGNQLYYCNAFFNGCPFGMPCEARLGVAQKVNDSTFNKIANTDAIFSNVNDTNYVVYAPQVTKDGLELYFTRILKTTVNSEICVSVRNSVTDTFSLPMVIHSNNGFVPEAPTPTTNKQLIYYHQKDGTGIFHLYLRYKTGTSGIHEPAHTRSIKVYPNPTNSVFNVVLPQPNENFTLSLYSSLGQEVYQTNIHTSINISNLRNGIYYLVVKQHNSHQVIKILKK